VNEQVGRDQRVRLRVRGNELAPSVTVVTDAVNEQDGWAAPHVNESAAISMDDAVLALVRGLRPVRTVRAIPIVLLLAF
jgi:hypothetical protein